jgi:hypothetical protein
VGLPLLMALFQLVGGYCAAFLVVPICGALTVWLTYALGLRLSGSPGIALSAALLVASSPVFLYQLMNAMSDVPATAAWTLALFLAICGWPFAAGLAMSAVILIRPNLAPLAGLLLLWTALTRRATVLRLIGGVAPGVLVTLGIDARLYESPLASGYGGADQFYAWRYVGPNAVRYLTWLAASQTPAVGLAALYFLHRPVRAASTPGYLRLLLGGAVVVVVASYLFYVPFDAWWYLRFLLPMWPVLMFLLASVIHSFASKWFPTFALPVLGACAIALAAYGVAFAKTHSAFDFGRGDRRYVNVARFIESHTDRDAVVFAWQHSGSVRHYAGRTTVRFDVLDAEWLDRAVDYLQSTGRHPYFLLDGDEARAFIARFGASNRLGLLDWRPFAMLADPTIVVYDPIAGDHRDEALAITSLSTRRGWHCDRPHNRPPPTVP